MRRWLLLSLVCMLSWQGAWAADFTPCGAGGGCPERIAAAAALQAAADATAAAAAEHDSTGQGRCNGDCSACHGQHLPALLGDTGLHLLEAAHASGGNVVLRPYDVQHAPLLRPPRGQQPQPSPQ